MLCNTKLPVRYPNKQLCTSTLNHFYFSFRIIYKFHAFVLGTSGKMRSCHSGEYEEHWLMTPCSLTEIDQNFGAAYCCHLHG